MDIDTDNLDSLLEWIGNNLGVSNLYVNQERYDKIMKEVRNLKSADYWSNWVYPEGANPEQIQNELTDYSMILENVSQVYSHITNGRISKQNTLPSVVIDTAEEITQEYVKERLSEILDEIKENYVD